MKFYSTNNKNIKVSFKDVLLRGMPTDKGLYMPEYIPDLSNILDGNTNLSFKEIGCLVSSEFIHDELSKNDLEEVVNSSITFDAPNRHLYDSIFCLELFHGPTLAFKDFGARFMARCMEKFISFENENVNILVATSGDTGSAVANGFYDVEGINVIILYPKGKVSQIQEKQLTTLDKNIYALEIEGTFDDCQKLVKKAFSDSNLKTKLNISSANSINLGRLIPQSFYYIHSFLQLEDKKKKNIFCVPSGNFGNITAGILAKKMGLPIHNFIASTNLNDIVPNFFKSCKYEPKSSISTMSNAMDVGNPSNMNRIMDLYKTLDNLKKDVNSWSFNEEQTVESILKIFNNYNYLLDPHSAIGLLGIERYLKDFNSDVNGIFLGTAHPAKFADILEPIINKKIIFPESLLKVMNKNKKSKVLKNDYKEFYDYLIDTFQ
ncbi:MAG: threonine synthase [Candidatus Marinimicrobia bacterium]|nr:threonine synthase [Candidatus Neomarinimicrobiota bacterium]